MADSVLDPGQRITDANGDPVSEGYLTFYLAGTTDLLTVYSNASLGSSLGSVVYTDSAGYPVAAEGSSTKVLIYPGPDDYKVVCKDADDVTLWTHDNIPGVVAADTGSSTDGITEGEADFRYVRNPSALPDDTTVADADIFSRWSTSDSENRAIAFSALRTALAAGFVTDGDMFPSGTKCLFVQTAAPTGWTKDTTHNDKALRIVSGTASSGGSLAFTSAFSATRSLSGTVGNTTLSASQIPAHSHDMTVKYFDVPTDAGSLSCMVIPAEASFTGTADETTSNNTGGGSSHTHSLTMTDLALNVQYVDATICTKD